MTVHAPIFPKRRRELRNKERGRERAKRKGREGEERVSLAYYKSASVERAGEGAEEGVGEGAGGPSRRNTFKNDLSSSLSPGGGRGKCEHSRLLQMVFFSLSLSLSLSLTEKAIAVLLEDFLPSGEDGVQKLDFLIGLPQILSQDILLLKGLRIKTPARRSDANIEHPPDAHSLSLSLSLLSVSLPLSKYLLSASSFLVVVSAD